MFPSVSGPGLVAGSHVDLFDPQRQHILNLSIQSRRLCRRLSSSSPFDGHVRVTRTSNVLLTFCVRSTAAHVSGVSDTRPPSHLPFMSLAVTLTSLRRREKLTACNKRRRDRNSFITFFVWRLAVRILSNICVLWANCMGVFPYHPEPQ